MDSHIRLFVGNLPSTINQKDLMTAFSSFGIVTHLDLKSKPGDEEEKTCFAFVTLSTSESKVESCIKHFSNKLYMGTKLYVTRARESFLERLQRERREQEMKEQLKLAVQQHLNHNEGTPVIRLGDKLTPKVKRSVVNKDPEINGVTCKQVESKKENSKIKAKAELFNNSFSNEKDDKKQNADKKRMDAIKRKRQEFKEKQQMMKMSFNKIDHKQNKKIVFADDQTLPTSHNESKMTKVPKKTKPLFDNADESGDDIKFDIKKQYEGKQGQKVLELQSRYKSDKRFVLDARFIDDEQQNGDDEDQNVESNEHVELGSTDEKTKQLNILQDVLGVSIKKPASGTANNSKLIKKLGMLRFDPSQPEHAKFLAPIEEPKVPGKKQKKRKKEKEFEVEEKIEVEPEAQRPEVSKEQFYKVSETLKEAIAQPTTFSLRSLFGNVEEDTKPEEIQSNDYIPLTKTKKQSKKVINPLDPGERNPFVYDSSDSEDETKADDPPMASPETAEVKAVWKENLFFTDSDVRLKEGLAFFNKGQEIHRQKERRELKSLMKKRIYNKERKNNMFQKKIGGRKKSMKKSYRKKQTM